MRKYVCLSLAGGLVGWRFGVNLAIFLSCLTLPGFAAGALPQDHHDLYAAFFTDYVAWQQSVAVRAAGNSAVVEQLSTTAAAAMRIDPKEAAAVADAATVTITALDALASQRTSYIGSSKGNPSAHVLHQFELRRQQIIFSGVTQLMRTLSRPSWLGLHTYINVDQRVNGAVLAKGGN